jgi:hypothetical protein
MSGDPDPPKRKVWRAVRSKSDARLDIEMIERLLTQEPGPWTPKLVRQGFSHLYNVNWKEKGVPETLRALAKKVGSYQGSLDASTASIVLKNLRNMGTRCRETREVLAVLILKLDECRQEFNVRQIRTSLYGLKSMSSDVREVRVVLAVLVSRIKG